MNPCAVLAGNHEQYIAFVKPRVTNPYTQKAYYEATLSSVGMHCSSIITTGTFKYRENWHEILEYTKAHLDPEGTFYDDAEEPPVTKYKDYFRRLKGKTKHGEPHVWERRVFINGPLVSPEANETLDGLREVNGEEYSYALAIDTADTTVNKENVAPYIQPMTGVVYTHYFVKAYKTSPVDRVAFMKPRNFEEAMAKMNRWNKTANWQKYKLDLDSCETAVSLVKDVKPFDPTEYATKVLGIAVLPKGMSGEKLKIVRKPGDVWRLEKTNSPMWTEQWGYQGSAKAPYIISLKKMFGGTVEQEWACSCPNWTRNVPRTDCKHILSVRLKEKMPSAKKAIAGLTSDQQKEFEKWQREKAAAGAPVTKSEGTGLNLFGETGRKFR